MPAHGSEVPLPLRHAIVTCRLLYRSSFIEIERKVGVLANTAERIVKRAIWRVGNDDFYEVLACVGDAEGRGLLSRIPDGTQLSMDVRNSMLKHARMSPEKAVNNKENISIPQGQKTVKGIPLSVNQPPFRMLLERVRKEHTHVDSNNRVIGKIVRKREAFKPRLNKMHEKKRKKFCEWVLEELDKGAIFICSDEKYHEIGGAFRSKNVTVFEEVPAEVAAVPKAKAQFTIMQFGSHSTEEEVVMGPIHLWKVKTEKERQEFDVERAVKNQTRKKEVEYHRQQATQPRTSEYKEMCRINVEIAAQNAAHKTAGNKDNKNIKQKRKSEQI